MKNYSEDIRSVSTRSILRKAFLQLLSWKNIHQITVRELCAEAHVNRGTFYTHYNDLYQLRCQLEEEYFLRLQISLSRFRDHPDASLTCMDFISDVFHLLQDDRDLFILAVGPNGDLSFMEKILQIGHDVCINDFSGRLGYFKPNDLEYLFSFYIHGCIGALRHWYQCPEISMDEILRMLRIVMSGCTASVCDKIEKNERNNENES